MALDIFEELLALTRGLDEAGVPYAIVGALALAVHGVPRATTDIDLLVLPANVELALEQARERGFRIQALPMRFSDGMELRRATKIEGEESLTLDLLIVDDNSRSIWEGRLRMPVEQGPLWVVSREGLIQMKARAARTQDLADIQKLQELDR